MSSLTPDVTIPGHWFSDWRFHALTAALELTRVHDTVGRFAGLIQHCKGKRTDRVSRRAADTFLGAGAAAALIESDLATEDGDLLFIVEATAEVERWVSHLEQRRLAAINRAANSVREGGQFRARGYQPTSEPPPEAERPTIESPAVTTEEPSSDQLSISVSIPVSTRREEPPKPPKGGRRAGKFSDEERAATARTLEHITARSGTKYQVVDAHVELVAHHLRKGVTEEDLRKVVAFCWAPSGRDWKNAVGRDDKPMATWFTPETLFGPKNLHKYLPSARAWYEEHIAPQLAAEAAARSPPANPELAAIATPRLRSVP